MLVLIRSKGDKFDKGKLASALFGGNSFTVFMLNEKKI